MNLQPTLLCHPLASATAIFTLLEHRTCKFLGCRRKKEIMIIIMMMMMMMMMVNTPSSSSRPTAYGASASSSWLPINEEHPSELRALCIVPVSSSSSSTSSAYEGPKQTSGWKFRIPTNYSPSSYNDSASWIQEILSQKKTQKKKQSSRR